MLSKSNWNIIYSDVYNNLFVPDSSVKWVEMSAIGKLQEMLKKKFLMRTQKETIIIIFSTFVSRHSFL